MSKDTRHRHAAASPLKGLRVVVADDHTLLRQGVVQLLERNGAEVVGQAATGDAALLLARKLSPNVVVMDVRMPGGMSGIEATARLREALPACRVIGFSIDHDRRTEANMMAAGAAAYVSKSDPSEVLLRAIASTHQQDNVTRGHTARHIGRHLHRQKRRRGRLSTMDPSELEP